MTSEKIFDPKALKGAAYVLYFYPKDNTTGCSQEAQDFARLHERFRRKKVAVFGVSRDSIASHEKFKAKFGLPFELVSDPEEVLCKKYDVIQLKTLYGRKFLGVERSTFLIDGKGKIAREWRRVKVAGHAEEVLNAAAEL